MIRRLQRKFIAASMLSLALVLLVILGVVNIMNYQKGVRDADEILTLLAANEGQFPQRMLPQAQADAAAPPAQTGGDRGLRAPGMSPETPYESRYFSVLLDGSGQALYTNTEQIAAVDAETAVQYAQQVWAGGGTSGYLGDYRFIRVDDGEGTQIIFLDCGRSRSSFRTVLLASVLVSLLGLLAVFLLLIVLSKRIVKPVSESYEKQRSFITDAGHELKTPLTIIGADTDLAEMELGESEWLTDIRRQTQRLTGLTNDLIYLSRMEEERPCLQPIEFPLSDLAEETVQSFLAPARTQGKEVRSHIQPMLSLTGDEKSIRQLLSILLDNALKYSPAGGTISLRLERQSRAVVLSVSNTTAQAMDPAELPHLFDRFYRSDRSRNSATGGYGLGLSIARSIVAAHRGKIHADTATDGACLTITVTLPA